MTIDVVTHEPASDTYRMILVEQGPSDGTGVEDHLRRLQDRLYDCVDAAIDGHIAARFPESRGKDVVIQLDCYDTPVGEVTAFFERFTAHISASAEIQGDMNRLGHVRSLAFRCHHGTVKERDA